MKNQVDFLDETLKSYDFSEVEIAIIQSKYHAYITDELYQGALSVLKYYGVGKVYLLETAGTFELLYACEKAMNEEAEALIEGIIALGCVIKGDTDHDVYLNQTVTTGLAQYSNDYSIPIGLGVLTVNNHQQALDRAGGQHGNKGKEAALAVLHSIAAEMKLV